MNEVLKCKIHDLSGGLMFILHMPFVTIMKLGSVTITIATYKVDMQDGQLKKKKVLEKCT